MRELGQILSDINLAIERFEVCKLSLVQDQSEILRDLSVQLHYLAAHKVKANEAWMSFYFNSKGKSNAEKEREADFKCPELYKIRQMLSSGSKVLDSMRTSISAMKQ